MPVENCPNTLHGVLRELDLDLDFPAVGADPDDIVQDFVDDPRKQGLSAST